MTVVLRRNMDGREIGKERGGAQRVPRDPRVRQLPAKSLADVQFGVGVGGTRFLPRP